MGPKTSLAVSAVLFLIFNSLLPADACRRGKPVDRQPPTLVQGTCPAPIDKNADPRSSSTVVRWTEPRASDRTRPITVQRVDRGPANGGYFHSTGSPYQIKYTARDGRGNTNNNLCSFKVSVTVLRCENHPPVTWGYVSCSYGNQYGSECRITCRVGYSIRGTSRRNCRKCRRWSGTTPRCTPIQCPSLPGTSCSRSNYYQSICTHSCPSGYSFAPGQSGTRVCTADGTWTGVTPSCIDTQDPTLNCPDAVNAYADHSRTTTHVTWELPTVTDNSKRAIHAVQTVGLPPGSQFNRGSHAISYEARDADGNTATCSFTVVVQVIQCPALRFLTGQRTNCSQYIYGTVCQFQCSSGFVLSDGDEAIIECQQQGNSADGVWSAEQPTCQAITCPELSPPANGRFYGNSHCSTAYGSWCLFECNDGFELVGGWVRRCLALPGETEGFWDGFEARCEVQTCPRAFIPNYAYITNQEECPATDQVPAESTCIYACRSGHVLTGSAEVNCGLDGNWDTSFPYCEAVTCDSAALPPPQNGIKNGCPHAEEIFGTRCTLSCNLGFMPTQPTYITCTDDGNGEGVWDGNTITCEEVRCDPLTIPDSPGYLPAICTLNGMDVIDTDQMQSYGTVCVASCDLGFTGSGSGSHTCLLTGQWDGSPLLCRDITPPTLICPPDIILFAGQGTSFAVVNYAWEPIQAQDASGNAIATLISINGQPVPANRSSIFHEGTYSLVYSAEDSSGNLATCDIVLDVKVARCPPLYGPQNGESSLVSGQGDCDSSVVYGSVCNISCQDGYTLSNGADEVTVECSKMSSSSTVGYWPNLSVVCTPNTCRVPAIPNGYISGCIGQEVDYQSSCTFVCNPGYRSNHTSLSQTVRVCLADGTWTREEPVCEAVVCTGLLSLDQGTVHPNECATEPELPYNTQCTFTCNDGFSLNGPYSKVCTAEGIWSDARPVSCTDYQPPVFTEICPMYFSHIAPPNMRQAVVNFETPEATDNSNDVTVTSRNPNLGSGSSFTEGTTRLTYVATDATMNRRSCDVYITVQVLRCRPLQAPASGSLVQCPSNIYGASCGFACNVGYNLDGPSTRTCERVNSGQVFGGNQAVDLRVEWSGESPRCLPITCPALPERPPAIRSGCFQLPPATELLGTTCNWYCPYGYGGVGSPQSICQANGTWDVVDFTCERRSCPALVPTDGMEISPANCLTSPTFNHNCYLRCSQSGYRVDPPSYDFIRCLGNGDWSRNSTTFTCIDYESPHFPSCPLDFIAYTPQGSTQASVTWDVAALDNSGETPSVVCSVQQPAVLPVGQHSISCRATDGAGNQATCDFEVEVKVRRCRPLNPPFYGNFIGSCDNGHGSSCQVNCQNGYTLHGADLATCSRNASTGAMYWARNGPRPTCQLARCQALPDDLIPDDGGVYPFFCRGSVQPYYGTTCTFYCRLGFELTGPVDHHRLTCLSDGTWDKNLYTLDVRCQDNVPPTLRVCPGSLAGSMSGQTLGVLLSFDVPTAADNSGAELTVVKTPPDIDSPYNFTQDTVVSYVFTDSGGNSVECTFNVNIQDNLSPVLVSCPEDQDHFTNQVQTQITWSKPEFRELTGDELDVSCSHQNGSLVPWGHTFIQCSATNLDNGKTTMCHFTVTIMPNLCIDVNAPRNGAKACDDWAFGRLCWMLCNERYDVAPSYYGPTFLVCGLEGTWSPPSFPNCVRRVWPGHIFMLSELHYFSGDCSDPDTQVQIKERFILLLNQSAFSDLCTQNAAECHASNVVVTCGPATGRRRRRDIGIWKESAVHLNSELDQLNASFPEVKADKITEHAQKWLAEMRAKGQPLPKRWADRRRHLHTTRQQPDGDRVRRQRSTMSHILSISFSLDYLLPADPTMSDAEFQNETWHCYDKLYEAAITLDTNASRGDMQISVPGLEVSSQANFSCYEPQPSCPFGHLPTWNMGCALCSVGQYFNNDTLSCHDCPIGQYQDEGDVPQYACKTCPSGTWTVQSGSTSSADCLGICPAGHFSFTRLQPCFKCDKGTYQSVEGSLFCHLCPAGQSTASIGSSTGQACAVICPAGSFSVSGLQPCTPCPLHSYQPEQGQSSCHPCPAGQITQVTGATHSSMCATQTFCTDTSCVNNGTCVEQVESFRCECPAGLTGPHCETDVTDCRQDSCFNGATCVDELNGFSCQCTAGYQGDDCSVRIDHCLSEPCENDGTCSSQTSGFTCTCDVGYTGVTCAEDIDECQTHPCQHGGSCVNSEGDYQCDCAAGFVGNNCEINVNECRSNPCRHNGACVDGDGAYHCSCVAGYSGHDCEIDVDVCTSNPCSNGWTCQDLDDHYQCACPSGRGGVHCELVMSPCDYQPCENDGICSESSTEETGYTCTCRPGFDGPECKTNVNECSSDPCCNRGICVDGVNSFQCLCHDGFEGPRCEGRTDLCNPNPCHHDAICEDEGDDYYCTCPAGLSGRNCETEVDVCYEGVTCLNGGTCAPTSINQLCLCVDGFVGEKCEINFDDCGSSPCANEGFCIDGIKIFTCHCMEGFAGTLCEIEIDECVSSPCRNGGVCEDQSSGYRCNCAEGFNGIDCENNKNDCIPEACDKGQCIDGIGSYECICNAGFTGRRCDIDINECQSHPCANGATCRDVVNGFICDCTAGWLGEQCEINEDDCASHPCLNSGQCIDGQQSYACQCRPGFTGSSCEVDIDECLSNPCHNQGTCMDGINSFTCSCKEGLKGTLCQINLGYCQPNPCKHGGSCTLTPTGFECQCQAGFEGILCHINIDDCAGHQCQHGASCIDQANRYSCRCAPGYTGQFCQTALDICSAEPCQNNAQCLSTGNTTHHCVCQPGFTGVRCEVAIDNCKPNPCLHGSTCVNGLNMHSCVCLPGYSGSECEQDVDECLSHPCHNGAECINGVNQYHCKCRPGYVGTYCSDNAPSNFDMVFRGDQRNQFITLHQAVTAPLRAFTVALWIRTATANGNILYYTTQHMGQTLQNAQFAISRPEALEVFVQGYQFSSLVAVNDNHWHHLAVSWDEHGGHLKIYVDGHLLVIRYHIRPSASISSGGTFTVGELRNATGTQFNCLTGSLSNVNVWDTALEDSVIQERASTCASVNPGSVIAAGDFITLATLGNIRIQTPSLCDAVDDCASSPCAVGSTCIDDVGRYICECPLGFTGQQCRTNIDDCGIGVTPCNNGGTCVDGTGNFTCQCLPGFSGRACELQRVDGCWSEWSEWDDCSQSCEGGTQSRRRSCTNPRPAYGGSTCLGPITESRQCNTEPCPSCRHINQPHRGELVCQSDGEEQNCTISCQQGYAFSQSVLPSYQCGPSTNYQWSHETEDNPGLVFPVCTKYKPPSKFAMEINLAYTGNLTCNGVNASRDNLTHWEVSNAVSSNLQTVKCVQDGSCAVQRALVSGCSLPSPGHHSQRRRQQSIDNIRVSIRIERDVHIPDQQNLTNEQVTDQPSSTEAASELRDSAVHLMNQSTAGQFAVSIDNEVYDIDSEQTETYGMPVCPSGVVRAASGDARCVPCQSGCYDDQGDCRHCPHGMYQSQEGTTYCQACARGRTTTITGATGEDDCTVIVP